MFAVKLNWLKATKLCIGSLQAKAKLTWRKCIAILWHRLYRLKYDLTIWYYRRRWLPVLAIISMGLVANYYWIAEIEGWIEVITNSKDRIATFRAFFLMLGGALFGVAAIAFSFIMFAMQVNIERLPHGLFRRLSSDRNLLFSFAGLMTIAFANSLVSLVLNENYIAIGLSWSLWTTILYMVLLLSAFRRALSLINPLKQLQILISTAQRDMKVWSRRAERARPLFETVEDEARKPSLPGRTPHDLPRLTYFQVNPLWTSASEKSILHAISFSRRYAENGDHEVSMAALRAIVSINASYVVAKGKTFFGQHLLFDNPHSSDKFINNTLEHLRQNVRIGVTRGDEQQIEQTLHAISELFLIYLGIDYADDFASPTHPSLAAAYLSSAVESVLPHDMLDVVMEGLRLMGTSAMQFQRCGKPGEIAILTEKIGYISCGGVSKESFHPITLTGMEQLSNLTLGMIISVSSDNRSVSAQLHTSISLVSLLFVSIPGVGGKHSSYLAPYYSATSQESFSYKLGQLINKAVLVDEQNGSKKAIIKNLNQWANDLYTHQEKLFLLALEKRSAFTFDMIHWIMEISKLLIITSTTDGCDAYEARDLRGSARRLISVLSTVPEDADAVSWVENWSMTECLFEIANAAREWDCVEILDWTNDTFLSWAWKAGRFSTGDRILERSLSGLAALSLLRKDGDGSVGLKSKISDKLRESDPLDQATLDYSARELRRSATELGTNNYSLSRIEIAMSEADHTKMSSLLDEIADLMSPNPIATPAGS